MTFTFDTPVRVDAVVISGIADDAVFHKSDRIRTFRLDPGGGGELVEGEIPDEPDPHRVDLGGVVTSLIVLEVVSTYRGEEHDGDPPTEQLAVAEVEILGQAVP